MHPLKLRLICALLSTTAVALAMPPGPGLGGLNSIPNFAPQPVDLPIDFEIEAINIPESALTQSNIELQTSYEPMDLDLVDIPEVDNASATAGVQPTNPQQHGPTPAAAGDTTGESAQAAHTELALKTSDQAEALQADTHAMNLPDSSEHEPIDATGTSMTDMIWENLL